MTAPAPAHRFTPPPEPLRCRAIVYRSGWPCFGGRCTQVRAVGYDLCARHHEMEVGGQRVVRVTPPRPVES